ncbi:MAG: PIN domain-containing protein [Candidatus Aenigmatarchaeota archaeon]
MTEIFFCDTYALIEIVRGNPNYQRYLNHALITSDYNLMELYYAFIREHDKETADKYFDIWSKFSIHIPRKIIRQAMEFKLANKKDNLSYTDCIGYMFSLQNKIRFLTGDIKFKNIQNVEFVKYSNGQN